MTRAEIKASLEFLCSLPFAAFQVDLKGSNFRIDKNSITVRQRRCEVTEDSLRLGTGGEAEFDVYSILATRRDTIRVRDYEGDPRDPKKFPGAVIKLLDRRISQSLRQEGVTEELRTLKNVQATWTRASTEEFFPETKKNNAEIIKPPNRVQRRHAQKLIKFFPFVEKVSACWGRARDAQLGIDMRVKIKPSSVEDKIVDEILIRLVNGDRDLARFRQKMEKDVELEKGEFPDWLRKNFFVVVDVQDSDEMIKRNFLEDVGECLGQELSLS